jgi:predicted dehydrogenase
MLEASNCEPVALVAVNSNTRLEEKYGLPCYHNEEALLSHSGLEAVYIASPVDMHVSQIKKTAAAGIPILVEKPLARTPAEAEDAVQICRESGVLLQEGYMMRFHGAHRRIKAMLDDGEIGRPVFVRAQLACWYPPIEGAWRQVPERSGGGALIDMATHLFDLLEMFMGPIEKVAAMVNTQVHDYPVDDSATTILQFRSGSHGVVEAFFCIPDAASRTRLEIYGSQGAILAEGTIGQGSGGVLEVYREEQGKGYEAGQAKDEGARFRRESFEPVNPFQAECEEFSRLVLSGERETMINSGAHGVHILRVVEAAYQSARTGRFLPVDYDQ